MTSSASAKRPNKAVYLRTSAFLNTRCLPTKINLAIADNNLLAMTFNYQALQTDCVRLLEPVSIGPNSLAFKISHYPRAAAPSYTAVSYTWGDGAPTERISINGQAFYVRLNLWSCLHYLGRAAGSWNTPWAYLWVDAICIDQTNDQERNAQVRLMDQIYRDATTVSVWLGLPSIPEFLGEQVARYRDPVRTYDYECFDWFDSIQDLANRPYWTRFWVIQECLLGRRVHLYCGNNHIDWSDFKDILGFTAGVHDYLQEDFDYTRLPSGSWAAWPLVTGRHPDKHPELPQSLYKLLVSHGSSQCKDPRDRVFALLGLVTSEERRLLDRFLPDYKMTEDDVVVIALGHVQVNFEGEDIDIQRLLIALGVESETRQKCLVRRSREFDYLDDQPPAAYQPWLCDHETGDFDASDWGRSPEIRNGSRRSFRPKHIVCTLAIMLLLIYLFSILILDTRWRVFLCKSANPVRPYQSRV